MARKKCILTTQAVFLIIISSLLVAKLTIDTIAIVKLADGLAEFAKSVNIRELKASVDQITTELRKIQADIKNNKEK